MPRQTEFAGTSSDCARILAALKDLSGVTRITLRPGVSKLPEGDVLSIEAALGGAWRWLAEVVCVLTGGGSVLAVKRRLLHRWRPAHE